MIEDPALIVVDLQNDFCRPGFAHDRGDTDFSLIESAIDSVNEFLPRYRASGRTPIFVRSVMEPEAMPPSWAEKYVDRPVPCLDGTEGAAFVPGLGIEESDKVVTKQRYNSFYDTNLESYLRSNDVKSVLVGGVATDVCVEATVRSAHDRGYFVTTLSDCTGSTSARSHELSLGKMGSRFGRTAESESVTLEG